MKLKLEYHILGVLAIHSATGYDIKKQFDTQERFDERRAPPSQIYTTLKRMTRSGLVIYVEERRPGKPDKKIYSITPEGRDYLSDFLHSPLKLTFRFSESSILFRIRYAFLVTTDEIIDQIQAELDFRQDQVSKYRHRDRSIQSTTLTAAELAYAQAINDELHSYGADRMDVFVAHLQAMLAFFRKRKQNGDG